MKFFFSTLVFTTISLLIGCGQAASTNTSEANATLSNSSIQAPVSSTTASNVNLVIATPTIYTNANPAMPSPAAGNPSPSPQSARKAASVNANIPDVETLRRQTQRTDNSNVEQPPPGAGDGMMMKSRKKPVNANN